MLAHAIESPPSRAATAACAATPHEHREPCDTNASNPLESAVSIEQLALAVRIEQGSPVELAVDVDQELGEPLERRDGDRQAVDLGAAASPRRESPRDDNLVVVE